MNAGYQRLYLTRKPLACLESALTVALREDYSMMVLRGHHGSSVRLNQGGIEPMEIDTFDAPRFVVQLDDDLRARIIHEYHDSASSGHFGRDKTYLALSRDFYWPHMYKSVRKWVRTCETCQR